VKNGDSRCRQRLGRRSVTVRAIAWHLRIVFKDFRNNHRRQAAGGCTRVLTAPGENQGRENLRRTSPAIPISPVESSSKLSGSGVVIPVRSPMYSCGPWPGLAPTGV
jgi:hypothetical protein